MANERFFVFFRNALRNFAFCAKNADFWGTFAGAKLAIILPYFCFGFLKNKKRAVGGFETTTIALTARCLNLEAMLRFVWVNADVGIYPVFTFDPIKKG